MNAKLTLACALPILIFAGKVRAQAPAPQWYLSPALAHVSVQATPATELEIVPAGEPAGSPAVARCTAYCDFWALPGKYTLYARSHGDEAPKALSLRIKHSSRYTFESGDAEAAKGGLVLGIVGSGAILTGMFMAAYGAAASDCPADRACDHGDLVAAGLVVLLAGVISTPIGWGTFAANRAHVKRIDEGGYGGAEPRKQVRVGVVGLGLGGIGLGGVGTF